MTDAVDTLKWVISGSYPTRAVKYTQLAATPETTFRKVGYILSDRTVGLFRSKKRPYCIFLHNMINSPSDSNFNPQTQQSQDGKATDICLIPPGGIEVDLVLKQGEAPAVGSLVQATGAATHQGKTVAYDQTELALGIVTKIVASAGAADGLARVLIMADTGPILITETIAVVAHYCYLTYTLWGAGLIVERKAGTATGGTTLLLTLTPNANSEALLEPGTAGGDRLTFYTAAAVTSAEARYMAVIP